MRVPEVKYKYSCSYMHTFCPEHTILFCKVPQVHIKYVRSNNFESTAVYSIKFRIHVLEYDHWGSKRSWQIMCTKFIIEFSIGCREPAIVYIVLLC
jgi:hypothetical protein